MSGKDSFYLGLLSTTSPGVLMRYLKGIEEDDRYHLNLDKIKRASFSSYPINDEALERSIDFLIERFKDVPTLRGQRNHLVLEGIMQTIDQTTFLIDKIVQDEEVKKTLCSYLRLKRKYVLSAARSASFGEPQKIN